MTSPMLPGQLTPNDFEAAILRRMAKKELSLRGSIERLHVLSREFTGVGSFTSFLCDSKDEPWNRHIGLDGLIAMPGVPSGMGAVLFLIDDQPKTLEIYAFSPEKWDGVYDGFSIRRSDH